MRIFTFDCDVSQPYNLSSLAEIRLLGPARYIGLSEVYGYGNFLNFSFQAVTDQTTAPIIMLDGLNDAVW